MLISFPPDLHQDGERAEVCWVCPWGTDLSFPLSKRRKGQHIPCSKRNSCFMKSSIMETCLNNSLGSPLPPQYRSLGQTKSSATHSPLTAEIRLECHLSPYPSHCQRHYTVSPSFLRISESPQSLLHKESLLTFRRLSHPLTKHTFTEHPLRAHLGKCPWERQYTEKVIHTKLQMTNIYHSRKGI